MKIEDYDFYVRALAAIEKDLEDIGENNVSTNVEHAVRIVKQRLNCRVSNALNDAQNEIYHLRQILSASTQPEQGEP